MDGSEDRLVGVLEPALEGVGLTSIGLVFGMVRRGAGGSGLVRLVFKKIRADRIISDMLGLVWTRVDRLHGLRTRVDRFGLI